MQMVRQDPGSPDSRAWISRELFRYLSVGVVNLIVGLSTIYLCMYLLHTTDLLANVLGYCVGITCSFVLNRRWTFVSQESWVPQLARFILVLLIAYLANLATVLGTMNLLGANRYLAQALGTVPYTVIGYIGSRLFAFRRLSGVGNIILV
jgi:putative flippase GtrA